MDRSARPLVTTSKRAAVALAGLGAALAAGFWIMGPERTWALFGPADLGPVRFETLERRTRPNDALACPSGLCNARADLTPPIFDASAAALRAAFGRVVAAEPRMRLADADDLVPSERWVQRSERLGFPDTIDVRFVDLGQRRSTLAIYSRSQIGWSDRGVNRARIERLLEGLTRELARGA
jgi:uncharacterized protein (DUF1499 family)